MGLCKHRESQSAIAFIKLETDSVASQLCLHTLLILTHLLTNDSVHTIFIILFDVWSSWETFEIFIVVKRTTLKTYNYSTLRCLH